MDDNLIFMVQIQRTKEKAESSLELTRLMPNVKSRRGHEKEFKEEEMSAEEFQKMA